MTRVLRLDPAAIDLAAIAQAGAELRAGALVAFPTETVYGVGANALDAEAVARIFAAKRRALDDPIIVHLAAATQLETVAVAPPALAYTLAERFWPGPLTLILQRHPRVPANCSSGLPTVAVRVPAHPLAQALLRAAAVPVAAPSANLFTRPSATAGAHVLADLDGRIDLLIDGGPTSLGLESTVLDLTRPVPTLLRPGGLPQETLQALLPQLQVRAGCVNDPQPAAAPGMLLKHYAPRAEFLLFDGADWRAVSARMQAEAGRQLAAGRRVGILASVEQVTLFDAPGLLVEDLGHQLAGQGDLAAVGRRLFDRMRQLDAAGVDVILVAAPPAVGLGHAIRDRLYRAAAGAVIEVGD